jgi:hypothetical protein
MQGNAVKADMVFRNPVASIRRQRYDFVFAPKIAAP